MFSLKRKWKRMNWKCKWALAQLAPPPLANARWGWGHRLKTHHVCNLLIKKKKKKWLTSVHIVVVSDYSFNAVGSTLHVIILYDLIHWLICYTCFSTCVTQDRDGLSYQFWCRIFTNLTLNWILDETHGPLVQPRTAHSRKSGIYQIALILIKFN